MKAQIGDFIRVNGKVCLVSGTSMRKANGASMSSFIRHDASAVRDVIYFLENGETVADKALSYDDVLLESEVLL